MKQNIKKNFGYNVLLTMSTYIFGLIVFPYVSRVLGVEMIGRINFADQAVNYLKIIASMGIATVGVREIAACGNDQNKRSQVFSDLFSFELIVTIISVIILLCLIRVVPRFTEINQLMIIGSFYLFFSSMMIEWFYQGTENFKFVTIRSIIVKSIYVFLVFIIVKRPEDYVLYYLLTTTVIIVNAIINLIYSRNSVSFCFRKVRPLRYAGSIMAFGAYVVMLSFFSTFNVVYLGFSHSEYDVGIYTTAIKVYMIILGCLSAFSTVMLPRMASLLSENKIEEYNDKLQKSFSVVFAVAPPLVAGGIILAPQIISVLAGKEYLDAVLPMRIVMPLVLVIGLSQIWVQQVLMPQKKDRVILLSSICAAIVGIALNIILVPQLSYLGSSFAILGAELTNNGLTLIYALHNHLLKFPLSGFIRSLVTVFLYVAICIIASIFVKNILLSLGISFFLCLILFTIINRSLISKLKAPC